MPKAIEVPHHDLEDFHKCSLQACVNLIIKNNSKQGGKEDPRLEMKNWLKTQIGQLALIEYVGNTKVTNVVGTIIAVQPITTFYPSLELLTSNGLVKTPAANIYLKYS